MHRKSLLSLFMLSMGVALLVAAMVVGVASAKSQHRASGGNLIVTQAGGGFDTLDPQLAYVSNDWGLMYNTELALYNFPSAAGDAGTKLIPQGATTFPTITNNGKTYTIHLRAGMKLSNGSGIGCANYVRSFERNLSPKMYAPYGIYDGLDVFLVGGKSFANGNTQHISGLSCPNNLTLKIVLTQAVPQFVSILGMPWFQAISPTLAYNNTPGGVKVYASGGPYYISKNDNDTLTVLKRNANFPSTSYFTSNWPSNPDSVTIQSHVNSNGTPEYLQAVAGDVDLAGVASQDAAKAKQQWTASGRFHVGPTTCIEWLALNNKSDNGTTNTPGVRKGLNLFLSRNAINFYAGPSAGVASDQVLVPAIPGYSKFTTYAPEGSTVAAAKAETGNVNGKHLRIYYRATSNYQKAVALYIQSKVAKLGMTGDLVESEPNHFYRPLMTKATAQGPDGYNIAAHGGWCADYADGYDYFNVNFDGRTIGDTGNTDYMYFNNVTFNNHMDAAATKTGVARANAYKALDREFMESYAPIVPTRIGNTRTMTSKRVHNWVYSVWWGQPYWGEIKLS